MAKKGAQVTALSGSPVILDIVNKTKTKTNQHSVPLYDNDNPITYLHEMAETQHTLRKTTSVWYYKQISGPIHRGSSEI